MSTINLFVMASMPILKVLLITAVGAFLALDCIDILGENARKHLNKVVFFVFGPALVASNLAKTVTFDTFQTMWFMPVNIFMTYLIGSLLGWILAKVTKAPKHFKGLIIGSCSAGSLGKLPIIIVPAMCNEKDSPFGEVDVCHSYAMAYASLSMALNGIFIWLYTYNIIRISSREIVDEIDQTSENNREPLLLLQNNQTTVSSRTRIQQSITTFLQNINLKAFLAPSTIGVIVGFMVGMISPLRNLLIGNDAPLHVVEDSAYTLGDACIPTNTLILGANLLPGLKGSQIQVRTIICISIVRYILLPLLGLVIVRGAVHLGILHADPLFQFILLLQYALPPAMSITSLPVVKVLLITALGLYLALDRVDILGENARHHLNKVVFYVFNPCLVASNLAKTVTFESFITLWFMPVNILITFIIGSALGCLLVKVTKAPKHLKGLIIGACSAGNLGNMLIILVPAMCKEKGSPFGAPDVCETYSLSYASLSMAIGAVYLWLYVYNVVRITASEVAGETDTNNEPLLPDNLDTSSVPIYCASAFGDDHLISSSSRSLISLSRLKQYLRTMLEKINAKAIFAPSTIAAVLGFAVGMTSPIRNLMIGNEAPLHIVMDSTLLLGYS